MSKTAIQERNRVNSKTGNWKHMGKGHVRGYPGLTHTALKISEYIPKCNVYVEPLAGKGRVAKHIKAKKMYLNDKSDFAFNYLKTHFNGKHISNVDFKKMFEYDSPTTVFLIDPPWSKTEYEEGCKNLAFCDRTPKEYYDEIFHLLPSLKGDWFVCGDKNNHRLEKSIYYSKLFQSNKKIMGGNISTLVMSNKPFVRYHQNNLGEWC